MDERPLIVGRGGLIGGALARFYGLPAGRTGIDWTDGDRGPEQLAAIVHESLASDDRHRSVFWCAGAGYVGASGDALGRESRALELLLRSLQPYSERVTIFLTSSAGAIHAGGPSPSSETSRPSPLTDYGAEKLRQEAAVRDWCREWGGRAVIGRLSNVYGPGQNLHKPQGLISQLVRASIVGRPLTIFVPMETSRDYLFVRDAAVVADRIMSRATAELERGQTVLKLVSSGRSTTIGTIVAELGRLRKKRPPVVFASTPTTALQPRVLGFRSTVWTDLDPLARTTMAEGISSVLSEQLLALGAGRTA